MLDLSSHIVKTKSGHFDPSHFEDRYENALIDLLKKKQAGGKDHASSGSARATRGKYHGCAPGQCRRGEKEGTGTQYTGASAG